MAVIRKKEIRAMPEGEMKTKIRELQKELMSERAKMATGGLPDNSGKMREMKKTIARLNAVAGERGYKIND